MKKILSCILVVSFIFFNGCASKSMDISEMDEKEILGWVIDQLNTANSIEWDSIRYSSYQDKEGEIVTAFYGDNKYIRKPFTKWARLVQDQGSGSQMTIETFAEEKKGELLWSTKLDIPNAKPMNVDGDNNKKTTIEPLSWNTTSVTGEQKDALIAYHEMDILQMVYLLNSNIDSFTSGRDTLDGTACIKYNGQIKSETILDYYEEFGRNIYIQMGNLEQKEGMSRDDLYNEIVNSVTTQSHEISTGYNMILFSDNPAPVSIWANAETGAIVNIKIDFTEATSNYAKMIAPDDQATYIEYFTEYRNIIIDGIKTLKRPD